MQLQVVSNRVMKLMKLYSMQLIYRFVCSGTRGKTPSESHLTLCEYSTRLISKAMLRMKKPQLQLPPRDRKQHIPAKKTLPTDCHREYRQ